MKEMICPSHEQAYIEEEASIICRVNYRMKRFWKLKELKAPPIIVEKEFNELKRATYFLVNWWKKDVAYYKARR